MLQFGKAVQWFKARCQDGDIQLPVTQMLLLLLSGFGAALAGAEGPVAEPGWRQSCSCLFHPPCAWAHLSPVSDIPTWLWYLLPTRISWAVCSVLPIDPFLSLQPTLRIWVAGGRCTVLCTLKEISVGYWENIMQDELQSELFSLMLAQLLYFSVVWTHMHCPETFSQADAFWCLSRLQQLSRWC